MSEADATPGTAAPGSTPVAPQARATEATHSVLTRRLQESCGRLLADHGRTAYETFLHNIPRGLFVFLPLLALFMKLLYRKPPRCYVEHLLFCIHNHAFIFLLLSMYLLATALIPSAGIARILNDAAIFYTLYYVYRALRAVYGQSRARTFAKFIVLSCWYVACGGLMLAIIYGYGALTL